MNSETIFRIIFILSFAAFAVVRMYYRVTTAKASSKKDKPRESQLQLGLQLITGLIGMGLVFIYIFAPQWLVWAELPLPGWLRWLGAILGLFSVPLLLWIHRTLGKQFSSTLQLESDHVLVTDGPYHWMRHPMYTALYMQLSGWLLLSANGLLGLYWLGIFTLIVATRIHDEETMLLKAFGDEYRVYMQKTGRFLPSLFSS